MSKIQLTRRRSLALGAAGLGAAALGPVRAWFERHELLQRSEAMDEAA